MRFRLGLVTGFAVGYVLGSKAGRQRYEQIRSAWSSLSGSEPAQQIGAEVRHAANRASEVIEQKAAAGVSKVTSLVHNGDEGQASRIPPS